MVEAAERWDYLMEAGLHALENSDVLSACECFEAAVEQAEAMGPDEPRLVSSLKNLVGVLGVHQRYDEVEPMLERMLDLSIRTLGPEHPDVVVCLEHLAWIAERHGESERALGLYRSAFDTEDRAYDRHDARALPTLVSLARLYHSGATDDGEQLSEEIAERLESIAASCRSQGRHARAEQAEVFARHLKLAAH